MGDYYVNGQLFHHGIKGQKWGERKYQNKDGSLTPAGKERYGGDFTSKKAQKFGAKAAKAAAKGKTSAADEYASRAQNEQRKDDFRDARKDISKSRTTGSKLVTNILAGPFANRTYNSVIAAGGSKGGAIAMTAVATMLGGPIGHLAVSALYTRGAGKGQLESQGSNDDE